MAHARERQSLNPNAFIGQSESPTDEDLSKALGSAKPVWDRLLDDLATDHEVITTEWKCYSPKAGWSLRLLRGKRTIVWMTPCNGYFSVTFILGDKAIHDARRSGLSARILETIEEAKRYPEGTSVRLDIRQAKDLATVKKLAAIKIAN
jgi:hypothetical protein